MTTNEILDALANASNCENAPPYLVTMAYQEMSRMQNVLYSVDVALDKVYPSSAPDVFEILKPMIKEFI